MRKVLNIKPVRPGYNPERMVRLIREAIARCRLDLTGKVVLTEAATGAYAVTPVIAAMARAAKIYAVAKTSAYGSCAQAIQETTNLAKTAGVQDKIEYTSRVTASMLGEADIVTNSGHLRPLDAEKIARMKPATVIPLMYEAWEFRPADVDLAACRNKGIHVAATNERHPKVDVFGYLGVLAIKELTDAGIAVYKTRILLMCDNDFKKYVAAAIRAAGATVDIAELMPTALAHDYDAILIAMAPRSGVCLGAKGARTIAERCPDSVVVQYFGDIDRAACARHRLFVWPPNEPAHAHMGIVPSAIGPEAIVRLQTGSLKAAEETWRYPKTGKDCYASLMR